MALPTCSSRWLASLLAVAVLLPRSGAAETPQVVELKVEPSTLTLTGPRDGRRFVVRGKTAAGDWLDLTRRATGQVAGDAVRLADGVVEPVKDGRAEVVLRAAGLQAR